MRDLEQTARRIARANLDELETILRHDPDAIRDVAAYAVRPIWERCSNDCAKMDSEFGPCTCGAEQRSLSEAKAYTDLIRP